MKPSYHPLLVIFFLSCFSASANNYFQQQDTTDVWQDCFDKFFEKAEPVPHTEKVMLVLKNLKTVSLKNFLASGNGDTSMGSPPKQGFADLDNDGKKELVLYDYTGGAHCCDEFFIFKNIAPNKYQYVNKTFAGDVCINDKNEFMYDFHQQYGYFFTCFACEYEDSSDAGPQPVSGITLKYAKGKLSVVPGDQQLKSTITDNLSKLKEQPYQKLQDEADQDNGLRKEFALNLVVYYYSFGKNLVAVQQLFNKYYRFPDAKKVWTEFVSLLNGIKKENDF